MKRRVNGKIVDEVFVEDAHEGIISKEQYLLAQKAISERSTSFKFREKGKPIRKLHDLIYCAKCGRKRYVQTDKKVNTDFVKACGAKVENNRCSDRGYKYEEVEKYVINEVKGKKEELEKEIYKLENSNQTLKFKEYENQIKDIQSNINKVNKRKKNLLIMRSDGEINKKEFEELKAEYDTKLLEIDREKELLELKIENLSNVEQEKDKLSDILNTIKQLETLDTEEVNAFLKTFINKIYFTSNLTESYSSRKNKPDATIEIEYYL
jgi:DNA repair exonuclease SbcCD ATPase subunit